MSFSSRRRNYLLTPHRRDGLIEWMKSMLQHSFVLDALETTGADTFEHFEILVDEHIRMERENNPQPSRLRQLIPTIGTFHTSLPLRRAFLMYNEKHRLTKRKHIQISFNEIRHILNLSQIMAMRTEMEECEKGNQMYLQQSMANLPGTSQEQVNVDRLSTDTNVVQLNGPRLISFDGDQTLYSDGANFESNPRLANYLHLLLQHGVTVAVVTAAGYGYNVEKYEYRLSGLLHYFSVRGLSKEQCESFYLFGGECNYLLRMGEDFRLHPVQEKGPGGWMTATRFLPEAPANWSEACVTMLLNIAEENATRALEELNIRGRVIRKRRSVGLIPNPGQEISRESLDEVVLRVHEKIHQMRDGQGPGLPYCAFNGGSDCWVDAGNKRVGVQVLQSYLGVPAEATLHIGDQFLNTGNDYAARAVSPCIWIISPQETTFILKSILRLADVDFSLPQDVDDRDGESVNSLDASNMDKNDSAVDFSEMERRTEAVRKMDVYTGELIEKTTK